MTTAGFALLLLIAAGPAGAVPVPGSEPAGEDGPVYVTYGVHNPPDPSKCRTPDCTWPRGPGEPADPVYPPYWQSTWTMYRVFNNYDRYPPPYRGQPPAGLRLGQDYEVSYGATYYDSTWRGRSGEGAMMEYYERRCLPIMRVANDFTCAFISLGDTAFFVTYDQDRPAGMPRVCLFSPLNHPPRRDFIKHLPYSPGDSERLGGGGQAYSFWVDLESGRWVQTGVSPDRTGSAIMFGYAFAPADGRMQPQSFYFSGNPGPPANAPIVSQNYTGFEEVRPDPARTWDQVSGLDPATLPACRIMEGSDGEESGDGTPRATRRPRSPTWSDIGRWRGSE